MNDDHKLALILCTVPVLVVSIIAATAVYEDYLDATTYELCLDKAQRPTGCKHVW